MDVLEEMVKELRRRVNISYEEAEKWLKKTNGDIDLAEQKILQKKNSFWNRMSSGFYNVFNYNFILSKGDKITIDIPFWILGLVLVALWMADINVTMVIFLATLLILVSGNKIVITDEGKANTKVKAKVEPLQKNNETQMDYKSEKEESHSTGYYEKEISIKTKSEEVKPTKKEIEEIEAEIEAEIEKIKIDDTKPEKSEEYYEIIIED